MDELNTYDSLAKLTSALGQLAPSSDDAFKQYIDVITSKRKTEFERSLARHVLTWVVFAKAPLTTEMIIDSFAIARSKGHDYQNHRPSRDVIMSICTGLIVLDSQSNSLHLVHDSVRGVLTKYDIFHANADLAIAKTCLVCLSMTAPQNSSDTTLLPYAAEYWSLHLIASEVDIYKDSQRNLRAMIRRFLMDAGCLVRAFKSLKNDNMKGLGLAGMTGLHAAIYFDLRDWLKSLINNLDGPNEPCADGQTALHWAVRLGRVSLVKYLVKKSADTNISDNHLNTPLHIALISPVGKEIEITKALLQGKARSDIPNKKRVTALDLAIKYGPTRVAEMLLQCRGDVNNETEQGWTPLREIFFAEAHCFGPSATESSTSWSALRDAFEHHVQRLFDIVLSRGVKLNSPTRDGWLPLTHAVKVGNLKWSQRLLAGIQTPQTSTYETLRAERRFG
jgi:ankyrin repeat protein